MAHKPRRIVRTTEFDEQCAALGPVDRMDEALEAVEWAIATNPDVFPVVVGTKVRVAKMHIEPPLRIAFEFNDETAVLLEIERVPLDDMGLP